MATPDFILELRELVGPHPLWLSGVSAIVVRGEGDGAELLIIRRADNGRWAPVAGIIEPAEQPADVAVREVAEEAGVVVEPDRIAGIDVSAPVDYPNGDRAQYLTVVVRLRWVSGDPHPVDGEATDARWVPVGELAALDPPLSDATWRRIRWALADDPRAGFLWAGPAAPAGSGPGDLVP